MHTIGGKSESFSAITFFSFSAAMTIGRMTGDYFINRTGRQKLLLINCVIAIVGLTLALSLPYIFFIITGFFMVGTGLSTIVQVVYSAAGNIKNTEPSAGIAVASTIGLQAFLSVRQPLVIYPIIMACASPFAVRCSCLPLCFCW